MTDVMYDSTTVEQIPNYARVVMGYAGPPGPANRFVTFTAVKRRFRKARCVSICVQAFLAADGLDIESGDATPAQFPGWFERMRGRRLDAAAKHFAYGPRDSIPAVIAAANHAGIHRDEYLILSAHVGVGPHICSPRSCGASFTADGTQWEFRALGRNLDESLLSDHFLAPVKPHRRPHIPRPVRKAKPHRKVTGATAGGSLGIAIAAALHAVHVHLTPAEASAIATIIAMITAWLTPSRRVS